MNRKIKFRAWDKKKSKMFPVQNMSFRTNNDVFKVWEQSLTSGYAGTLINPDFAELMQYTGLNDKQGREIYEGDIVKSKVFGLAVIKYIGECMRFQAEALQEGIAGFVITANITKSEVIGNIYENPDLLK